MSERTSGSGWIVAGVIAGAGVLLVAVLGVVALVAFRFLSAAEPGRAASPPLWRELVMIECDADGKVKYQVGERTVKSEAELTAELKRIIPQREFRKGDGIEVSFMITSAVTLDGDSFSQKQLDRAKAACEAAGARVIIPKGPMQTSPMTLILDTTESGRIQYKLGSKKILNNEDDLRKALARLVKERGDVSVQIELGILSGVFQGELDAAKAACEAGGATVVALPKLLDPQMATMSRSGKRSANVRIMVVGVRDGVFQFRTAGKLVEGESELTKALRKRIAEIEQEKGGFTLISPCWEHAPELVITSKHGAAVTKAIDAAGPQVSWGLGFRGGIGRRRSSDEKAVTVNILNAVKEGNRYQLDSRVLDGEKALTEALRVVLADWRKGKRDPQRYFLQVRLRVEVKPGITATEEQIKLAHRTVGTAKVSRPAAAETKRVTAKEESKP